MAKRQAYTRRKSGETRQHDRRARQCLDLNAAEIRAACDAALRRADVPINMSEEVHLKHAIKEMRAKEKLTKERTHRPNGIPTHKPEDQTWPEESAELE